MEARTELTTVEYKSVLMDTLIEFDTFCRRNDIKYFLIGGTLLGAIRHKGFIPWDDDIDIGMPQEDYNRFKKLYKNNSDYYFIDCLTNKEFYLPYGKFCCNHVDLLENINTKLHIGAFIDIFAFNFVKEENEKGLKKFMSNNSLSKLLMNVKYASYKGKNVIKKVIIGFCHFIYPFSLNYIARKKIKRARKYISNKQTPFYGNLFGVWGLREISSFNYFEEVVEVEFEGKKFFAPRGYDSYLKKLYGDYMSLPPIEKQISHHSFKAYFKN